MARYSFWCAVLVAVSAGVLSVVLPEGTIPGLWVAGAAAWVTQGVAAGARVRWGSRPERLLAVWGWSAGGRLAVVGLAAWAVYAFEVLHPVTTLVGLAGYLFAMLLLEPVLLKVGGPAPTDSR